MHRGLAAAGRDPARSLRSTGPVRARVRLRSSAHDRSLAPTRAPKKECSATEAGRLASTSPSEGLRRSLAAAATSPPRRPPLLGSVALQSLVCNEVSGCLGYLIPPRRSSFPSRPRGVPLAAVPHELSPWVHPLVRLPSLQSFSSHRPLGQAEHLPWAFLPHRDVNLRSPRARASRARSVPSSAFRTPSTVSSSAGLAGLFHPAATSRVRSSGSSPREKPYGLVARRCPLVVHAGPLPSVLSNGARVQCPPPGPFSTRESVAKRWWFRPPPARYPPELLPPSGSSSRAARTTFVAPSDHGLSRPPSCYQRPT